jgi:hypothetical protein
MAIKNNIVTYYIRWEFDDKNEVVIRNNDFDIQLTSLMMNKIAIKPILVDDYGISNSKINEAVDKFLRICKEQDLKHYCPYRNKDNYQSFAPIFRAFLNNLLRTFKESTGYLFDVFVDRYSGDYFKVYIPFEYCPKEKYEDFIALGPDDLIAKFSPQIIFDYVFPRFLLYLFDTDRLDANCKEADLLSYKIGLH